MESHNLYRVKEEDLDKLIRILTVCFSEDPLYHALIPDRDTRERLMPELFTCDLTEFFETCEIYADSSELNSILVVSDGTEHEAALHNLMISLETHNPANVSMYEKFGFKLYGIVQKKGFDLKQYCMIKQA